MTKYTGDDIYCDLIIPRDIDIKVVKETNNVLAFHHTRSFWKNHIVVIPKKHISSLLELEVGSDLANELLEMIQEVASDMKKNKGACRVLTNLGEYQDSKHIHFHVSQGEQLR